MPSAVHSLSRLHAGVLCGVASLSLLGGCATNGNPRDPLEPLNRAVYQFNDGFDKVLAKPAAEAYRFILPNFMRTGVSNFFSNINDVIVLLNSLLQGKLNQAGIDLARLMVNTTVGVLGLFDVATELDLEKHNEDFGQTLGVWGVANGPYLMIPLLGPSDFRDAVGLVAEYYTDPEFYLFTHSPENWIVFGTRVVNLRANLLDSERIFDVAAMDKYAFLRDAYLQRRRSLIYDGNPPSSGAPGESPRRKTLKEMEEELDEPLPPAK
jgi:phospholipid-binding lipoprotein MlaA